jgi:hypothetical protein
VTKGGTSAFHGSAFGFLRDKALNARGHFERFDVFGNPVTQPKPPFRQTQWGATLGGPLRKDRTFFFASHEDIGIRDSRFVAIDPGAADVLNRLGFRVEVGHVPLRASNAELLGKIDHHWRTARSVTRRAHYADVDREGLDEYGGTVARSRSTVQHHRTWSVSAAETDVVSARWINELRVQYAHEDQRVNPLDPSRNGPCTALDEGGPTVEVTGVASVGRHRFAPQRRLNRRIQLADTVSYLRQRHHVKLGGDYNDILFPSHGNLTSVHAPRRRGSQPRRQRRPVPHRPRTTQSV